MYHRRLLCAFAIRFLLGIVLGALLLHWQKKFLLYQVGFLNESTLKRLEMLPFQPRVLFLYYLKKYFGYYMMLFLLSASEFRRRGIDLVSISMGILQGAFLATAYSRFGRWGVGLYFAAQFPGGIVWMLCFFVFYVVCQTQADYRIWQALLLGAGFAIAGAWAQSYVNPFLLQKFLHIFFSKI